MATRIQQGFHIFEQISVSITQGSFLPNLVKIGSVEISFKEIVDGRTMTSGHNSSPRAFGSGDPKTSVLYWLKKGALSGAMTCCELSCLKEMSPRSIHNMFLQRNKNIPFSSRYSVYLKSKLRNCVNLTRQFSWHSSISTNMLAADNQTD